MLNRHVFWVVFVFAVSGCATQPESDGSEEDVDDYVTGTSACFFRRQVADFRTLDRSNLIVYAPTKSNAYHVTISPPSTSLRWADAIGFKSRSSRICGYAGDRILIDGSGSARQFSITNVYRLDDAGHDSLLAQYGKGQAGAELEPLDTAEAEIEREIDPGQQAEE